jgi:hypothetical protein
MVPLHKARAPPFAFVQSQPVSQSFYLPTILQQDNANMADLAKSLNRTFVDFGDWKVDEQTYNLIKPPEAAMHKLFAAADSRPRPEEGALDIGRDLNTGAS